MSSMGSHVSGLWSSGTTGLSQVQRSALGERRSLVAAHQTRSQSVQENSRQPALRSSLCSSGIELLQNHADCNPKSLTLATLFSLQVRRHLVV
ncbi:MAG: hypothetical protein RIT02_2689 [Planctomycetota bacterium]